MFSWEERHTLDSVKYRYFHILRKKNKVLRTTGAGNRVMVSLIIGAPEQITEDEIGVCDNTILMGKCLGGRGAYGRLVVNKF